jgi:hypothetical protein
MMATSSTGTILGDRLVIDMSDRIAELEPNKSPLITLTKKMKKVEPADNPEFHWMEQDPGNRWTAIAKKASTGWVAADTELEVTNVEYFRIGDLVKVPSTGEVMLVSDITAASNKITVARAWGSTSAPAKMGDTANVPIVIIGNANAEGAKLREIMLNEPVKKTNYTQIIRTPVGVTNTLQATKTHGPRAMNWYRHLDGINHAVDMERTMWFGEKGKDTVSGKPRRTTGGILEFLTANVLDCSSVTLTEQSFSEWLGDVFRYGASEKILYACSKLCTVIDMWAQAKIKTVPKEKTYGVAIKEYVSTHGTLYVVKHKLFEGAIYGSMGVILDMDNLKYRPLKGRDTKLLTNRQDNDADEQKDEYLTEFGVEVRLPKTHAVIKNVS